MMTPEDRERWRQIAAAIDATWDAAREKWKDADDALRRLIPDDLRTLMGGRWEELGPRWFDRDGKRIASMGLWCMMMSDENYRAVARDQLPDGGLLSTVWLGLDHGWFGGDPLIFETMRFGPTGELLDFPDEEGDDTTCVRYSTEAEALVGHAIALHALLQPGRLG